MAPPNSAEQTTVELDAPLGVHGRVKGPLEILILVVGLCVIVWMLINHERDTKDRQASTVKEVQQIKVDISKKFDEVVYVLSLNQEDRDRLHLTEPETLRARSR